MSATPSPSPKLSAFRFSIDGWAVLIAFALTALVRAGVLRHIPW